MANEIIASKPQTARIHYGNDGGGAIVRLTKSGEIHSILKRIKLSESEGQFYKMGVQDPESKWPNIKYVTKNVITARGYDLIRSMMGMHITFPDFVLNEEGKEVCNPYPHSENGMVSYVKVRAIGTCRGPSGNWQAQDLTFIYNFQAYLAEDLYNKWFGNNKKKNKGKDDFPPEDDDKDYKAPPWGCLLNANVAPPVTPDKIRFPVQANMVLECDLNSRHVHKIVKEHLAAQKFAERNAISMCVRNIVRKLTGLYFADENGFVDVVVWVQEDKDFQTINNMISRSKEGVVTIDGDQVQVMRDQEEVRDIEPEFVSDEEIQEAEVEPQTDTVDMPPPPPPGPDVEPPITKQPIANRDRNDALAELREVISKLENKQKHPKIAKFLDKEGMKSLADIAKAELTIIDRFISELKEPKQ